jgi:organic radical activating enzyme
MLGEILNKLIGKRQIKMRDIGISLFPTSVCDTGCTHCLDNCSTKNPTYFPVELAKEIIKEVKRAERKFAVLFTGNGEPLMAPDLLELADVFGAYKRTEYISLITSGFTHLDGFRKSQLEELLRRPYKKKLHIEQSFNLFHSSFPERLENIIELMATMKHGGYLIVRACMSYNNRSETWAGIEKAICAVASKLEATHCFMLPVGWDEMDRLMYFPLIQELVSRIGVSWRVAVEASLIPHWCFLRTKSGNVLMAIQPISFEQIGRGKNIQQHSWARFVCDVFGDHNEVATHLSVRTNGDVYPECTCPAGEQMKLGTIGVDSLASIAWRKDIFAERLRRNILADKRMFEWGTYEVCVLCQQIVAERGIELV